jgi:hypothetical protein
VRNKEDGVNATLRTRLLEVGIAVAEDGRLSDEDRELLTLELAVIDEAGRYHSCGEEGSLTSTCLACKATQRRLDQIEG